MLHFNSTLTNLFTCGYPVKVIPVNCVGVMGAGLALQYRKLFPLGFAVYKQDCESGKLSIGNPTFYCPHIHEHHIFFPTKDHWQNPSELSWIRDGLSATLSFTFYRSWAWPMIGAGLGGLNWHKEVMPLLFEFLEPDHRHHLIIERR